MSIETETGEVTPESRVAELAAEFGEAITELPVYQKFAEAKERVENDDEAQEKIQEFEQIRDEFMMARQTGEADQEAMRTLQEAQEELHSLPVMSDYLEAQSELELRLQELNEMVSEELVVDFGEKAGGCCED
ncbi:YlbF family regulator [Halomicrobium urmianum]|uniref:YlbF family regulator n=1 Tax=Halomicrobium urmianum TaxID=1586233 RepID=UPI001CD9569C|nr:YlbF family regulator [Halomicrobium urmianum]